MKFGASFTVLLASVGAHASILFKRAEKECGGITAPANNGGRKIGIVVDSSGSMSSNDRYDLRIAAGRQLNTYLIPSNDVSSGTKEDLVTVVDFDDVATLLYPLGDPDGADATFSSIDSTGGTDIAAGVRVAISQLNSSGHDPTADRSGIIVLTDGSDTDTKNLVYAVNNATAQGIRVSFGFLVRNGYGSQNSKVLGAIFNSGGQYATITDPAAQQRFINLVTANGLTKNDPSTLPKDMLMNGLAVAGRVSGDGEDFKTYSAKKGEILRFAISSVDAGTIEARLLAPDGQVEDESTVRGTSTRFLDTTAQSNGDFRIIVKASNAPQDAMYLVGVNSSAVMGNCTFNDDEDGGLSVGGKAGIGIGVPLAVGLLATGTYFLWKGYQGVHPTGAEKPAHGSMDASEKGPDVTSYSVEQPSPFNGDPNLPANQALMGHAPGAEQSFTQPQYPEGTDPLSAQASSAPQAPLTADPSSVTHAAQGAADGLNASQGLDAAKAADAAQGALDGLHSAQATQGLEAAKGAEIAHGAIDGANAATGSDPLSSGAKGASAIQGTVDGINATSAAQGAVDGAKATAAIHGAGDGLASGTAAAIHPNVGVGIVPIPPQGYSDRKEGKSKSKLPIVGGMLRRKKVKDNRQEIEPQVLPRDQQGPAEMSGIAWPAEVEGQGPVEMNAEGDRTELEEQRPRREMEAGEVAVEMGHESR